MDLLMQTKDLCVNTYCQEDLVSISNFFQSKKYCATI